MAFIIKDRVKENTTITGTGAVSLGGAAATFDTFQSYMVNGDTTYYAIVSTETNTDEWEVGLGTWNTGNTLTRTTVLAGSNGTNAVNFGSGNKDVFMTYPAAHAALAGDDVDFANITVTGTVDGRDVATDGTKLDTIETNADVTDAVNVAAAGALMKSGGTMTGALILNADPNAALGAATKQYVDTIAAAGLHYHAPVRVQTTANLNATYNNGSSGVGATLTNAGTNAAITIDNVALSSADRVLVSEQTDQTQNGVYTVTTVGDGSTAWVLTRSTDTDSYAPSDGDSLGQGDAFFIKEGDTNAGHLDVMSTAGTITFGTTNIVFNEVAETTVYSGGTGVTLTGTTFSIGQDVGTTANVTFNQVTAAIIGNVTGNVTGNVSGNAGTATKLATARTIQLSGDVTGSASFDGSANINITAAVQDDSHAHVISNVDGLQTELDAKVPTTRTLTAGNGLTGGGDLSVNRTLNVGAGSGITVSADAVAHADTSSQASVNNSNGTVIQDVTLDDFGHVTGLASLDGDARWVNVAGDTMTGNLTIDTNSGPLLKLQATNGSPWAIELGRDDSTNSKVYNQGGFWSFEHEPRYYNGGSPQKFFHDGYHPNADKWTTARTLSLSGDASGSVSWDGSADVTLSVTVANDSHTHVFGDITSTSLSSSDNLDNYNTRALAHWGSSNPSNSPYAYGAMFVIPDGSQSQQLVQTYGGAANKVSLYGRRKTGGTWDTSWTQYFSDHYHPNADKWTTARTLSLSGDASGSVSWDGSADVTLSVTVADNSHSHSWSAISGNTRQSYTTAFQPPNSTNYAGFTFYNTAGAGAGYFLVSGSSVNNTTYQPDGITLVTDSGWLSLVSRTTTNTGVRIATGATPATRMTISDAGDITFTGVVNVNPSGDQKIVLSGSADPYIRFQEGTTDRAYIQYSAGSDALRFGNQEADNFQFLSHDATGAVNLALMGSDGDFWGYVYATDLQHVGFLDEGGSWAIKHQNDNGTYFYTDGGTEEFKVGRDTVTGDYGTVQTSTTKNGYGGYSINSQWVFMSSGPTISGIYNDTDNEWAAIFRQNAEVELFHNGALAMETVGANGIRVGSTTSSDIYMQDTDHGERRIHCNSNRLGFLDSTSNWSFWSDDAGDIESRGGANFGNGTLTADGQNDVFMFASSATSGVSQSGAFHNKLRILGGSSQSRDLQLYQVDSEYAHIGSSWSSNQLTIDSNFSQVNCNTDIGVGSSSYRIALSTGGLRALSSVGHTASSEEGIFWHTDSNYSIHRTAGAWTNPTYQQLEINWPTGIIIKTESAGTYTYSHLDVQAQINANHSGNQKIVLTGSADPYIRFQEGTTNRAYIQWNAANDALSFANNEADYFDFYTHDSGGAVSLRLRGSDSDTWGWIYATDSQEIGFLDEGGSWAYRIVNDSLHEWRITNAPLLTLTSTALTLDCGTSSTLNVKCDDAGLALIRANGDSQGTGAIEVGQSNLYGGGISYNGDGTPAFVSGETADHITFYRNDGNTRTKVFSYPYNSNTVTFNGSIVANNMYVDDYIYHNGDTNTYMQFNAADSYRIVAGGSERVTVNSTGVRVGNTNNGYFQGVGGNYGSIQIDGGAKGGWEGYSIGGRVVFMHDNSTQAGIYNDVNNHWLVRGILNGAAQLFYGGGSKLETTSSGVTVNGDLNSTSDIRYKKNIETIDSALEKVQSLRGVTFDWDHEDFNSDSRATGVIAQDVEKVLPEAVRENEDGFKNVAYGNMIGLLVEAIKEQQEQIDMLTQKLNKMENK